MVLSREVQDDFTIFVRFKSTQGVGTQLPWYSGAGLLDGEVTNVVSDFGISLNSQGRILCGTGNPDTFLTSNSGFNNGSIHTVTLRRVRSSGSIDEFVDGSLVASATGGTQALNAPPRLVLGSIQENVRYFAGQIAEVLVYKTALSNSEIQVIQSYLNSK
jgi:hypothetical protein